MTVINAEPAAVIRIRDRPRAEAQPGCPASQGPADQAGLDTTVTTSRAMFGDLAAAACRSFEAPAQHQPVTGLLSPGQVAAQADEFLAVLPRLLKTIGRYTSDIAAATAPAGGPVHDLPGPWERASAEVRQAAQQAYRALPPELLAGKPRPRRQRTGSLTRDLAAAATAITAARDLLQTRFETSADGTRRDRSEWAPLVTSGPVRKALLREVAEWSRHVVSHGTRIASAAGRDGSGPAPGQRRVLAVCRSLTGLITAVETAHGREPVTSEDISQLYRIPVSMLHPRALPASTETVAGLRRGIIECAERVRSAAAAATVCNAAWSAAVSAESFAQTAVHAAAISGHCEVLLQSLAARAAQLGATRLRRDLLAAAAASARAREAWLGAVRAWYHVKTDAPGDLGAAALEAGDLARWTGRLAYADPRWELTSEAAGDCRPPQQLAPGSGAFTRTLAAVHQAASTLTALATADYSQIRTAACSGRLLVPAVQIPGAAQDAGVYARAPRYRMCVLLAAYRDAGTACIKAGAKISAAAAHDGTGDVCHARPANGSAGGQLVPVPFTHPGEDLPPGPVERILYGLGVTEPDLLSRAVTLDQSFSQLVADAADRTAQQRWHPAVVRPGAVTSHAAVARQVLTDSQPAAAAALHASLRSLTQPGPQSRGRRNAASCEEPALQALPRAS